MKLSMSIAVGRQSPVETARLVQEFEHAGADAVWLGEGYGFDVPTSLGYLAAVTDRIQLGSSILNTYSRTPAALAQTAAGLDWLSGGRAMLGLGTSGPQVIEGFHGVPFGKPVQRMVEIIDICRKVWRREAVSYDGDTFQLPLSADRGGSGVGKSIKLMHHPVRDDIPIWLGTLGPRAVEETAAHADGWLTYLLIPEKMRIVWGEPLERGLARRDPSRGPLQIQAGMHVAIDEDIDIAKLHEGVRSTLALYIGGMGAKGKNFYNDLAVAYGYVDEAATVQDLFLSGRRAEAAAAVPQSWIDAMCIVGPRSYVAERLAVLREAGVTQLSVDPVGASAVKTLEQLKSLVG
ncbi:MAG: LLM class F420-dependent oxidoreductase [Acidimicrobiia bacterium]